MTERAKRLGAEYAKRINEQRGELGLGAEYAKRINEQRGELGLTCLNDTELERVVSIYLAGYQAGIVSIYLAGYQAGMEEGRIDARRITSDDSQATAS